MVNSTKVSFDADKTPYIDLGSVRIRFEREEAPEWALEKAKNELRETPDIVEQAFSKFRQILDEETCLKVPRDEFYLKIYLRSTHYYPESAMKRLRNFFQMKIKYPDACTNVLPAKLQNVFEADIMHLLPTRDQYGRRILIIQAGRKWKPSKVPVMDLFKCVQLFVLGAMKEPLSQICGAIVIIDMEDLPMSHIMNFTPSFAAMLLTYLQDCICLRLKAVHIVHNSLIFNILFNIFKPFLKEKLRNRIYFHGKDLQSLHRHIDKSILPDKYGGTASWELPHGKVLGEFFNCFTPDFEEAANYGFTEDYKAS